MTNSLALPISGSAPAQELAVKIRNLNYFYGQGELRKQVLFDINLDLPKGQIVIMTGPSGSGKTTLLSLIGALRTVQDGSLNVLGQEVVGLHDADLVKFRRNIGFIFQAHNLFESLTACQNVEMAIELWHTRPAKRQRAIEILTQVGLSHRIDYKPKSLSGGQNQRVAISRALVNQPALILADEPTAALDKQSGREVVLLMQKLAREQGRTILMVTHDNRILDVVDRIISMVDGRLESDENLDGFVSNRDPKTLDRRMFMT
jgi:putative ABC transport system ATP-binding protein